MLHSLDGCPLTAADVFNSSRPSRRDVRNKGEKNESIIRFWAEREEEMKRKKNNKAQCKKKKKIKYHRKSIKLRHFLLAKCIIMYRVQEKQGIENQNSSVATDLDVRMTGYFLKIQRHQTTSLAKSFEQKTKRN